MDPGWACLRPWLLIGPKVGGGRVSETLAAAAWPQGCHVHLPGEHISGQGPSTRFEAPSTPSRCWQEPLGSGGRLALPARPEDTPDGPETAWHNRQAAAPCAKGPSRLLSILLALAPVRTSFQTQICPARRGQGRTGLPGKLSPPPPPAEAGGPPGSSSVNSDSCTCVALSEGGLHLGFIKPLSRRLPG